MAVLSMLIVPILSVVNADLPGEFGGEGCFAGDGK